ncbi:MAG: 3-dehydroquinate synthase [Flavobacteriaceae bacterium]|nr:3-dehydroquinate synthase [Flavobacteriaceae bacterium]|tara:strand:+ start:421 stop:1488 length:1068 start_codon:yes stop_codon:yes gene_type:complete
MDTIKSNNSLIVFGNKGLELLKSLILKNNYSKLFVLVDENTKKNCLSFFLKQLENSFKINVLEIKSGEVNKNTQTCEYLWNELSNQGADRKSALINLGGGVICDLGGFVASTFKRGISFYNVPTTLLSMVDASVGGKTGIDFGLLKNQIGVFNEPKMVLIFSKWLKTLDKRQILSGFAEMLKHGLILDKIYWDKLSSLKTVDINNIDKMIYNSVVFKNSIVLKDLKEKNIRKVLNFGHTLGHAVESSYLGSKQELLHGEAIAIGMILESFLSYKILRLSYEDLINITKTIIYFFKKIKIENSQIIEILNLLKHDKKTVEGKINFVLLNGISDTKIDVLVDKSLINDAFKFYNNLS